MNIVGINDSKTPEIEQVPGYIVVHYTDGTKETLQVDSFGIAQDMPGFLTIWSDSVDGPLGFLNNSSIKKIMTTQPSESLEEDEYNS